MGESERYSQWKRPGRRFNFNTEGNALTTLFAINIIGFIIMLFLQVAFFFAQQDVQGYEQHIVSWIALPASLTELLSRPWTIITYFIADVPGAFIRLLSNMIWLWAFGVLLQEHTGNTKIIPVYIYGGLMGALFFIVANYSIPPLKPFINEASIIGANAGVMAVAVATTALAPQHRFFTQIRGGIPIWVLTGIYILIDFVGVKDFSAAYSLAHLGGGLAGYLFVVFLRNGKDGSIWMNKFYDWVSTLFAPPQKIDRKAKVFYQSGTRRPFTKEPIITQERVDTILDKINQHGLGSLSKEEKQVLKKAAEEDMI